MAGGAGRADRDSRRSSGAGRCRPHLGRPCGWRGAARSLASTSSRGPNISTGRRSAPGSCRPRRSSVGRCEISTTVTPLPLELDQAVGERRRRLRRRGWSSARRARPGRRAEDGARQADALAVAAGQDGAAFADRRCRSPGAGAGSARGRRPARRPRRIAARRPAGSGRCWRATVSENSSMSCGR